MIEIVIKGGLDEYSIVGTKDCTIFNYRNSSKLLVWEMNWNSLMNYFIGRIAKGQIIYLNHIASLGKALEQGLIAGHNLEGYIRPLLQSFDSAKYQVEIVEVTDSYHVVKTGVDRDRHLATGQTTISKGLWAGGHPFVYAIQEEYDPNTVSFYKELIRAGVRPQVIFIKGAISSIQIILDGHHKLQAYNEMGINPSCVQITKQTNYQVPDAMIHQAYKKHETADNQELLERLRVHLEEIKS